MTLPKAYTNNYGKIPTILETIRGGQAPSTFSRQHLRDLGFKSSHDFTFIQVLKELDLLTSDGSPTPKYMEFLDKTRSEKVLGDAVRRVYADIFVIKAKPTKDDTDAIAGKFKSEFNSTDAVAKARANTFLALLALSAEASEEIVEETKTEDSNDKKESDNLGEETKVKKPKDVEFCYNIQIHLPPTKDIEVYNAIFKSLKDHLIE